MTMLKQMLLLCAAATSRDARKVEISTGRPAANLRSSGLSGSLRAETQTMRRSLRGLIESDRSLREGHHEGLDAPRTVSTDAETFRAFRRSKRTVRRLDDATDSRFQCVDVV
ncbi:hypothetical protein V8D89_009979 [Ganoderma adspersum]